MVEDGRGVPPSTARRVGGRPERFRLLASTRARPARLRFALDAVPLDTRWPLCNLNARLHDFTARRQRRTRTANSAKIREKSENSTTATPFRILCFTKKKIESLNEISIHLCHFCAPFTPPYWILLLTVRARCLCQRGGRLIFLAFCIYIGVHFVHFGDRYRL